MIALLLAGHLAIAILPEIPALPRIKIRELTRTEQWDRFRHLINRL